MSSSKRERHGRKEKKDTLRIDAYDPQMDPSVLVTVFTLLRLTMR